MIEANHLGIQINQTSVDIILEHGLSKSEIQMFFYLLRLNDTYEMKKMPSIQELATATGVSYKTAKQNLVKLNQLGLYERETNPDSIFRCGRQPNPTVIK